MTKVYFVRHAQPEHDWEEDRTRPLTEEGVGDAVEDVGDAVGNATEGR